MRGSCGRVAYRRRAVACSAFGALVCDTADICEGIKDQDAPYGGGDLTYVWEPCIAGNHYPNPGVVPGSIEYDQEGGVALGFVAAQLYWNPAACFWVNTAPPGIADDCRSYIEVVYTYTDSFSYDFYDDAGPPDPCQKTPQTYSVTRSWICHYSRRVQANQFMAVGVYKLVRCEYPAAINTIGPTGGATPGCGLNGGIECSADGLTSLGKIPTLWQPPSTIVVTRDC